VSGKGFAGVKGMNDILPPEIDVWHRIEAVARELFGRYGFSEIRTPIVEDTALFVRSIGEVTDVVGKEMYTFTDKGDRSITMRPEGTAPAARAYIEHGIANTEPLTKWFYMGPMFRYERMKTGRYRQFYQLGAEAYGTLDPAQDVEVLALCWAFFQKLGIPDVKLHLNSLGDGSTRPQYLEALKAHFAPLVEQMSPDAKLAYERNTMRLLDSKEGPLQDAIKSAPSMAESLDEGSKKHFADVQRLLGKLGIPFVLDPRLVRGLDYYTRTSFEFIYSPQGENALGTAGTICGGGRYDRLVHELGGPEKPAVGFAMGLDRLVLLLKTLAAPQKEGPTLFIGTFDGPERDDAIALVMQLRNEGYAVDFDPRGGKLGKQKERASKLNAAYFAGYGDAEHKAGSIKIDNMRLPKDAPKETVEVKLGDLRGWLNSMSKKAS
jgi:histidyl-tRNA synthetase